MIAPLLAAVMGTATMPAASADYWLYAEWCDEKGEERMYVEATGVGFNEHTICQWTAGPPTGDQVVTTVSCANIYPNGDETVRMDERMVRLEARKGDPDKITVMVEGEPPAVFLRCEE
jgi:hypothetical protein